MGQALQRDPGACIARAGAITFVATIAAAWLFQGPVVLTVGQVEVVHWPGEESAAMVIAELADAAGPWPGIPESAARPIRVLLAGSDERFDSLTRGLLPEWGGGAAFPRSNTIVLKMAGDVRRVLWHELAHLALHSMVSRVPLWFDEGYAARAAGEWGRLQALRLNWALLTGFTPTLGQLNSDLRAGAARAEAAYALATTAVLLLERLGGERGLEPFLSSLAESADIDRSLRVTYQVTLGQFEELWRQELRRRYGWILLFSSLTVFWAVLGIVLMSLWWWRRRRDRDRREALDEGWEVPPEWHASA